MHHSGDVLAIYSISFHRNSVRIVGTIFGIRFTHPNLKKKSSNSWYWWENWTLLLKKEHRQFFRIGWGEGGTYLNVKNSGRENNLYKVESGDLR
jgi:hypothetical protein